MKTAVKEEMNERERENERSRRIYVYNFEPAARRRYDLRNSSRTISRRCRVKEKGAAAEQKLCLHRTELRKL